MPAKLGRSAKLEIVLPTGLITIWTRDGKGMVGAPGAEVPLGAGFRMQWDVTKTLHGAANRARIVVHGLSARTYNRFTGGVIRKETWTAAERATLAAAGASTADPLITYPALGVAYIRLEVGYQGRIGQIFEGDAERLEHVADQPNSIVQIDAGDNGAGIREGTISQSWGPGTPLVDVVGALVQAMGGYVSATQKAELTALSASKSHIDFPYGFTAHGQAHTYLSEIMRLVELRWSFQDGEFMLLSGSGLLPLPPVELNAKTGLVGQPRVLEGGGVRVVALQDAELRPGRAVLLISKRLLGTYRVEHSHFVGDTHGGQAVVECELGRVV